MSASDRLPRLLSETVRAAEQATLDMGDSTAGAISDEARYRLARKALGRSPATDRLAKLLDELTLTILAAGMERAKARPISRN